MTTGLELVGPSKSNASVAKAHCFGIGMPELKLRPPEEESRSLTPRKTRGFGMTTGLELVGTCKGHGSGAKAHLAASLTPELKLRPPKEESRSLTPQKNAGIRDDNRAGIGRHLQRSWFWG